MATSSLDEEETSNKVICQDSPLKRATEFLLENSRIGTVRTHYEKYQRYVPLRSTHIFNALVDLYAPIFQSQWPKFRGFMDSFTLAPLTTAHTYAARCYISMWFIDLYASNREAVKKISTLAFIDYYRVEIHPVSREYDQFLSLLNASIRPTHIKLALEDALYIPYISSTINVADHQHDYFGITNFFVNEPMFYGLVQIMKDRKRWNFTPLADNVLGRPCWLFDWHPAKLCCAWFHMEGNFNLDDVTLAYIVGVACTPKLGPRDTDDWQFFPNGQVPESIVTTNYQRIEDRRFYGSYEVTRIDIDRGHTLIKTTEDLYESDFKKQKTDKTDKSQSNKGSKNGSKSTAIVRQTQATTEPTVRTSSEIAEDAAIDFKVPRYRVINWTYSYLLVLNYDEHTRNEALRLLTIN